MSIPSNIDHMTILADLKRWGWADQKIEVLCGFGQAYVNKLKNGAVIQMRYDRAARLYNLWCEESERPSQERIQTLAHAST